MSIPKPLYAVVFIIARRQAYRAALSPRMLRYADFDHFSNYSLIDTGLRNVTAAGGQYWLPITTSRFARASAIIYAFLSACRRSAR